MSSERQLAKDARLFAKGDPGSFMATVLTGSLRLLSGSRDGREVTLNAVGPGGMSGLVALLDGRPRCADAVATKDTVVLITERRVLLPLLAESADLSQLAMQFLCGRLRKSIGTFEDLALFDLSARLARMLLNLARTQGETSAAGMRIGIRLSQREMAAMVFGSRESVNKQLRVWREARVLTTSTGLIVLHDMAALHRVIDGDSGAA